MTRLLVLGSAAALLLGAATIGASAGRVLGVVTAYSDKSLQVTSKTEGTTAVGLDEKTDYTTWITHKPLQQNTRASLRTVAVGSCVDVELRANGGSLAKTVRISAEPAGSIFDPCKTMR
jgi:hypothetical protein